MLIEAIKEDQQRMSKVTEDFSFVCLPPYEKDTEDLRNVAIYWMAVAMMHILTWIMRREKE